jgi:hypothetical protein
LNFIFIINDQGAHTLAVFAVWPAAGIRSDAIGMFFAVICGEVFKNGKPKNCIRGKAHRNCEV